MNIKSQCILLCFLISLAFKISFGQTKSTVRERILLKDGWKFFRYENATDTLIYDVRPEVNEDIDKREADARPVEGDKATAKQMVLKSWILPTGNDFLKDLAKHHKRPKGNPGENFPFVQHDFDDQKWESISIPHDWAIRKDFYKGWDAPIGGGMGRLPVHGVGWYRNKLEITNRDNNKSIYLDIDGAMSYAMVWINGKLAGGWPYGYTSFRINLTPYLKYGGENQIAIRIDNPPASSRWYPGAGIYRNVWLTKTSLTQVGHWGTHITAREISEKTAKVHLDVNVKNESDKSQKVKLITSCYHLDQNGKYGHKADFSFEPIEKNIPAEKDFVFQSAVLVNNPKLWGPAPEQIPNRYIAITKVYVGTELVDEYTTKFGIRSLKFDASKGLFVNGKSVVMKGVNQHHDLGSLGTAFNVSAAKRQLDMLLEVGCNAIRMAHNPPATELLELTDSLGFLVIDEIYDNWKLRKTPLDFHLIFDDWYEQDLRAFIRRDRNHPSIIMWSYGNEVGEQYTDQEGAILSSKLNDIVKEEDSTRPTTVSMNYAKAHMPFAKVADIISLNYQGEGIRNAPAYSHLKGITAPPSFPTFRQYHPDKMIVSSENAAAVSSRGEYYFPVFKENSAPVANGQGGNDEIAQVSSYELYTVPFGSSADKVFTTMDANPFVAGGFVWTGWDYLGEPTPYYQSKSSYFGIIDLAGFKKDRFYLYQSYWRSDFPMAHILPHWNWENSLNDTVPVHVFTSGDEGELFLNGKSLGTRKKHAGEYRLRWDDVRYQPGDLHVITYKNGKKWAENKVSTSREAYAIKMSADKNAIKRNTDDLIFVTVEVVDKNGLTVPTAKHELVFSIDGGAEIVATDNGDANDLTSFSSLKRNAFNGKALVIIKGLKNYEGNAKIWVKSEGLLKGEIELNVN
ncbi:beta-galactosidase GalB [Sphingobacterium bovistauri]|uniref:DUF4982 domain-containing protein n=1 Tax=Sphingobacterium bovistauri TaxID=2781959 RepID=A0ABS7Z380_9SPHI|nr:beta-galactosidase GalB [Sphingobacterium bovistauri]MCA5004626.1 DUF4982 domain-containing protein [Sphingobacterium bovistauri]